MLKKNTYDVSETKPIFHEIIVINERLSQIFSIKAYQMFTFNSTSKHYVEKFLIFEKCSLILKNQQKLEIIDINV